MSSQVHLIEPAGGRVYDYPEQDPNYQGQQVDEKVRHGPLNDRGCHDIFFVFLYLICWALMGYIGYNALQTGDPSYLFSPFDSNNNHCGYGAASKFEFVYIVNPIEYYCVINCPLNEGEILNCYNCSATAPYPSKRLVELCYPTQIEVQEQLAEFLEITNAEKNFSDLEESWPLIAGSAAVAFLISILLTYLIRCAATCIVWGMIILYLLLLSALGTVCFLQAKTEYFQKYRYIENQDYLLGIAYTSWVIAGLSLLIVLCLVKKINLAIAILKASADFTRDVFQAIFVPIIAFIFIVAFIGFWLVLTVYIYSSGDIQKSDNSPFFEIKWDHKNKYELLFYLFCLFWNCNFAVAFCQFILASACCMWYFSHMGNQLSSPICRSFCRGMFHHLGSLLLGALILAIVQIISFVLNQIHKAMKETVMNNDLVDNQCAQCGIKYCKYIIKCFERFIRFLNQNAYIMIALTGKGFCQAAYDAFYLIFRNAIKVAITHGLGEIFEFLGTLFICCTTSTICYFLLTQVEIFNEKITSPLFPTLAFAIISFIIGRLFMTVYGIGTDSILFCYLADYELHKNEGGAKSMPRTLKEFMHEYS